MEGEKKKLTPEKMERVEKLINTLLKNTKELREQTTALNDRLKNIEQEVIKNKDARKD